MKQTTVLKRLLMAIAIAIGIIAFWGCPSPNECPAPTNLSLDIESSTSLNYQWEGIAEAQFYQYTFTRGNGNVEEGGGQDTFANIAVQPPLQDGEKISFSVRAECGEGVNSSDTQLHTIYRNVASVEVIYRESDIQKTCNNKECDYVRFDETVTKVCGLNKSEIDSFNGKIFLKKDFCACYAATKCSNSSRDTSGFEKCLREKQANSRNRIDCN